MSEDGGFTGYVGIRMEGADEDGAEVVLDVQDHHRNPHGSVHGGAIATLVDTAMGRAVASTGDAPVTIEMKVTYLEPAAPGRLRAAASVRRRGSRIVIAEVDVTDESGDAVAHAIGTFTST